MGYSLTHWAILIVVVMAEYWFAFFVLNFFAFRDLAPKPRAIRLTIGAWVGWSSIFALRAETPEQLIFQPMFFGLAGIPIGYMLYRILLRRSSHREADRRTFE